MPSIAMAQGVSVPTGDPAYADIDRLIDAGLLDVAVGQRPYSRRTFARLAHDAERAIATGDGARRNEFDANPSRDFLGEVVRRLIARFGAYNEQSVFEAELHSFESAEVMLVTTDAKTRAVPGNGAGDIEADLNTLTDQRQGRRVADGSTFSFESAHSAQLSKRLAISFRPRIARYAPRAGSPTTEFEVLNANARYVAGNVAYTVGRENTEWGTSDAGGLFFSANAPALDMVRIASEAPFRLPGPFRRLPEIMVTAQLANLGPSVSHSQSKLLSYKVSALPSDNMEVGASFSNHFGGNGARNASAVERFFDFMPILDVFRHHSDTDVFDSDKLLGVDGRWRVRQLANVTLFSEMAIEDFDPHRLRSVFTEDAAYILGATLPEFLRPDVGLTLSYRVVGKRFYEHHLLTNGLTSRRFTLGDELGHDAWGWYAALTRVTGGVSLRADAALEDRGNDTYETIYLKPDTHEGFVFRRTATVPRERRYRAGLSARLYLSELMSVGLTTGAEKTRNFGFVSAQPEVHAIAALSILVFR